MSDDCLPFLILDFQQSRLRAAVPPSPSLDLDTASTGSGGGTGQRDRRGSGATSRSSSPPTESEERYDVDSESENTKASQHQQSTLLSSSVIPRNINTTLLFHCLFRFHISFNHSTVFFCSPHIVCNLTLDNSVCCQSHLHLKRKREAIFAF